MDALNTDVPLMKIADAQRILQAAKKKAQDLGVLCSICIVDQRGDPMTMLRMNGARWEAGDLARGKAFAAAIQHETSAELQVGEDRPLLRGLMMQQGGKMTFSPGGVPIWRDEEVIGGVGCHGGGDEKDEEAAKAGADAL